MTVLAAASLLLLAQDAATVPRHTPIQAQATKARLDGRLDEAVLAYKRALQASPGWSEGWYFLGTIHYENDRPRECADSFARFVTLAPKVSAGHALLGLCLYRLKQYPAALSALNQAERIGLPQDDTLTNVASFHAALLYTKEANFEKALKILGFFSRGATIDPKVIELTGIAALRRPIFPEELPATDREIVYRVGRAVMTAGARRTAEASKMLEELVQDFPKDAAVHFVYGTLLLGGDTEQALRELEEVVRLQPDHLPAHVVMGLEYLRQSRFAEARARGEAAVKLAPGNFTARTVLGRALVEGDLDVPAGLLELETAVRLEPGSPQVRIALASAYAKAGRREDAAKQRAEFLRLRKELEGAAP
jgi:tetratricopeptide (TPR) repeat protein